MMERSGISGTVHLIVRRCWLVLAWPLVWLMDVGIWLLDCGNWFALRCESRYLWTRAWRKRAPNAPNVKVRV